MTLRARVLAGAALIAIVLGFVLVAITRTTEAKLLSQVDTQLQHAAGVGRLALPSGGPPPQDTSRRPTSLYVGVVRGDSIETLVAPNLVGDNTPIPAITAAQAVTASSSPKPFTVGSNDSGYRYRARVSIEPRTSSVVVFALPIDSIDNTVSGLVTVEL